MIKPVLAILCFALSTTLSAQTNTYISNLLPDVALQYVATANHIATLPPVETAQATNIATTQHTSASESLSAPEGHGVPNKAYSVRGGVSYVTANGIRVSNQEVGISVKHFFKRNEALEVNLSTGWQYTGGRLTGLYEVQRAVGTEGFYWIWGVGAHTGLYKGNYWTGSNSQESYQSNGEWHSPSNNRYTLGISAILGVEYHLAEAPFTIGADFKPSVDLLGMSRRYGDAAISVRYTF